MMLFEHGNVSLYVECDIEPLRAENVKLREQVAYLSKALERIANMDSMSYHSLESAKITARNANLIAAAPDLLEASIMAIKHYDAYFKGVEPPEDLPWVPVMRSAIAKAIGTKP